MSRSYPTTYPILLRRKTARRGNHIPRRALQSRDGRIRTGDSLNPIRIRGKANNGKMSVFRGIPGVGAGLLRHLCCTLPRETHPQTHPRIANRHAASADTCAAVRLPPGAPGEQAEEPRNWKLSLHFSLKTVRSCPRLLIPVSTCFHFKRHNSHTCSWDRLFRHHRRFVLAPFFFVSSNSPVFSIGISSALLE